MGWDGYPATVGWGASKTAVLRDARQALLDAGPNSSVEAAVTASGWAHLAWRAESGAVRYSLFRFEETMRGEAREEERLHWFKPVDAAEHAGLRIPQSVAQVVTDWD
jgi:hypothetical protein